MCPFESNVNRLNTRFMLRQREIISLLNQGQSQNAICSLVHCSKRSVSEVSKAVRDTGKSYGELLALSDSELLTVLSPQAASQVEDPRKAELERLMPEVMRLLKGRHATMQFVHETFYKKKCPEGYDYTQFKLHVTKYRESHDYSYHNNYEPGEQMQIDFAGDALYLTDRRTGKPQKLVVLVCVMPYSNLPFMMAMPKATTEWFFHGLNKALEFMGALPKEAKSDNMKQWVTKSERYSLTLSDGTVEWATYYGIEPTACRVRQPRDKGPVESAVNNLYHYVYARIENDTFYELADINSRIWELLDEYCSLPYKGSSRWEIFEKYELPNMRPLPQEMYRFRMRKEVKLGSSYHVCVGSERHFYSVPCKYVGQTVKVMWDVTAVEIYVEGRLVWTHDRKYDQYGYTTVKEHMPESHLAYEHSRSQNAATLIDRAQRVGPFTRWAVEDILQHTTFPQQAYGTCNGVLSLGKTYGYERLESAAALMKAEAGKAAYRLLANILRNNRDKAAVNTIISTTPQNDNVRGASAYRGIVSSKDRQEP